MKNLISTLFKELKWATAIIAVLSLLIFFIMRELYIRFPNICIIQKTADFVGISITYFMTVLAFSITAFALTQLISGNSSFPILQKTDTYRRVVTLFRDTTIYHVFALPVSFIIYFSFDYLSEILKLVTGATLIGMIFLSLVLIKKITNILFTLLSGHE